MTIRWNAQATRQTRRNILVAVHTKISVQRTVHVMSQIATDERMQVFFTRVPNAFGGGVKSMIRRLGGKLLPWREAKARDFDLVVAADYKELHCLRGPVLLLNHGAGFNKLVSSPLLATSDAPGTVCGLGKDWLLHDGMPVAAVIHLTHREQLSELSRLCPEAVPRAIVAGDPYCDEILDMAKHREKLRAELGLSESQELVVVVSTWGPRSLLANELQLVRRLVSELPKAKYMTAAILHPHIWQVHGEWQIRQWLKDCLDRGLRLMPPDNWVSVIVSSDCVIGDHGSLTLYATMCTTRILLVESGAHAVVATSPMGQLYRTAPRASSDLPALYQVDIASRRTSKEVIERIARRLTSEPGNFARNIRDVIYSILRLEASVATGQSTPT